MLERLLVIDYRHTRFAVDPRNGLFNMVRFVTSYFSLSLFTFFCREWRDPNWTGIVSAQVGIDEATKEQRKIIFGENEIDIGEKSTMSLLVDEVGPNFWLSTIN